MTSDDKKMLCIAGIIAGGVIGVASPFIGLAGTIWGMMKAFNVLGTSGVGDPSKLSAAIGECLISTVAGLVIAIPGVIFVIVCMITYRKLDKQSPKPPILPPDHATP